MFFAVFVSFLSLGQNVVDKALDRQNKKSDKKRN